MASKNRYGRFAEGDVLRSVFEMVVRRGIAAETNRARRGAPAELEANWGNVECEGPVRKPPKAIPEADPQAAWPIAGGPGRIGYETNDPVDDRHAIIVGTEATPARPSHEIVAAKAMLERGQAKPGSAPRATI